MNDILGAAFTKEEVHKALFDLNPSKAPGPNDFTALFFQDAWDIISKEITDATLRVLNQGGSLKSWNPMVFTLIPKTKEPDFVMDCRPISLKCLLQDYYQGNH